MIKCLKRLCISLLIGLPILFVNYSSATYSVHTIGAYVWSEYQVSVLEKWDLNTISSNISKSVFAPTWSPIFFWDSDSNARLIAPNWYDCQNSSQFNYFYLCDEIPDNNFTNMTNCTKNSMVESYISEFMWSIKLNDNWAYEINTAPNTYYSFNICFSSKVKQASVCYFYTADQWANQWCYQWWDMTWDKLNYNFDTIPSEFIWRSPGYAASVFNPTPTPDFDFDEWDDYTNWQIIEWFEAMWISEEFCYWWFALDNIFNVWDTPESFTWYRWGSGVNILDIYDSYSGAFSTPKWFLRNFYQAYLDNNYNPFYWSTKSLYWFFDQIEKTDISQVGFNSFMAMITPTNVYEYCYLKFKTDPNAKYDWDNRNAKFAYYSSGTINLNWRFSFSWNNNYFSWVVSWVDSLSWFFANMNAIFQWNLWSIGHQKAMLPTYIIVFMLAIILVRILKH